MRKFLVSLLVVCFVLPLFAMSVSEKVADSTVLIKMKIHRIEDNREGWGVCSGVYIKDNIILSAVHCVNVPEGVELKQLWIKKAGGVSAPASVIKIDSAADMLLLYTPLKGTPIKFAKKVIRGEDCWIIGNPLGIENVLTKGIVSKLDFKIKGEKATFMVVDSVCLPGNSGGAVIDHRGRLIGILTRSTSIFGMFGASGLGIVVDLRTIREFLK